MKTVTTSILFSALLAAPAVYADCPASLPHEQLMDCIVNKNAAGGQQSEIIAEQTSAPQTDVVLNNSATNLAELKAKQ